MSNLKMSKNETNKLLSNTVIRESLNTRRVTRQQTAQTEASVSHKIPLYTHVTTMTMVIGHVTTMDT